MTAEPRPLDRALLRDLAPQVLGALARRYSDFAAAEEAVQEALLAAATQWPIEGVPSQPRGWLIRVASRRMQDHLRAELARRRREAIVVMQAPDEHAPPPDEVPPSGDDTLALLFMCSHPALTRPSAVALTLRAVGGLTTREIASAYMVPEATMGQRISRAKQRIRESGARFELPSLAEQRERLGAVLQVLYLIFNEGYATSGGDQLTRTNLSAEAIRLTRAVHAAAPDEPETAGLLALMLLTDARRAARTGLQGELVPLHEQDRARWDRDAIREGTALVEGAFARGRVGPYQLQAAIAALHDEAPSIEATDWAEILALYGVLARITGDNPMVRLNQAIAVAMVHGPQAGLAHLESLDAPLAHSHRLAAVRAHLHAMAGERRAAIALYREAAGRTASIPERDYLLLTAARLEATEDRGSRDPQP